ncbi:MAG: phosphatase PAP2 family protein [Bacteroidota bacterium]
MSKKLQAIALAVAFSVLFNSLQAQTKDRIAESFSADNNPKSEPVYARPRPFSFITNLPKDVWGVTKSPFQKNGWKRFLALTAASAVLIHYDQQLLNDAMSLGRTIHWQPQTDYKVVVSIKRSGGDIKIFKMPRNINSAFYNLGEGWIGVAIGGGFWLQGKISNNYRSLQTASDLMEGFTSAAILTQVVKRISGRQSPFMRTAPGGRWKPFPSFGAFGNNTANYDAFPSGHLATMMTTITILAENYPENKWIRPIGYTLMGLTSFAMMNTEVHWAGDYPLALVIGYLNGKIITARHKRIRRQPIVI